MYHIGKTSKYPVLTSLGIVTLCRLVVAIPQKWDGSKMGCYQRRMMLSIHVPKGYKNVCYLYYETSWGEQGRPPKMVQKWLERAGKIDWCVVFMVVREWVVLRAFVHE